MGVEMKEEHKKKVVMIGQEDVEEGMLLNRLNPHFLYNTLETIRMMARKNDQTEIEEMIKMLGRVLRGSIEVRPGLVSLQSEMRMVESYLRIQQYRFGDRIRFEIHIECSLGGIFVLPLMIQPLVENAYRYGLEEKEGKDSLVSITVRKGDNLQIIIEDNGVGIEQEKFELIKRGMEDFTTFNEAKINLSNIHQRIQMLYGEKYGITIHSAKMQGTKVEILLPIIYNPTYLCGEQV